MGLALCFGRELSAGDIELMMNHHFMAMDVNIKISAKTMQDCTTTRLHPDTLRDGLVCYRTQWLHANTCVRH
jgi:hypothetical protein